MPIELRPLLILYGLVNAVLYSTVLPLWEGFDEPFHFGYVQALSNGGGFPDPRTSRLSQEIASSLLLTPASLSVKRNLPEVTSYTEFFAWPEARRIAVRKQLRQISPRLRWLSSNLLDYEALQAPLAYVALALPERALSTIPLLSRVIMLRILAGAAGALLLLFGAERLAGQLGIPDPYKGILLFSTLSSQMIWATLAHIANDWLAVPLTVWLLAMLIRYQGRPSFSQAAFASASLSLGLLTKAYFLAFVPLVVLVYAWRRKWLHLIVGVSLVVIVAGPWYVRNVQLYGSLSGMQELREGVNPMIVLNEIRIGTVPATIDSWSRSALWTANNTFRSFSTSVLRTVTAAWFFALLLWATHPHRSTEWTVVLHSTLFSLALTYDAAINNVASHGKATSPCAWYSQVLFVPMLCLAFLGTSRSGKLGKGIALLLLLSLGYVGVATYWVKLIPLYCGFEGRTTLSSVVTLYTTRLSAVIAGLNDACPVPGIVILFLSGLAAILAVVQQFILARMLLRTGSEPQSAG